MLGSHMGFRRVIFLFNRIDEGIPLTPTIEEDLRKKIEPFALQSPDGGRPQILGISALHAFQRKHQKASGPTGKFAALEQLLHEYLDAARVKQISRENLSAVLGETQHLVLQACGREDAETWLKSYDAWEQEFIQACRDRLTRELQPLLARLEPEVGHRREQAAGRQIGGPFGAYIRSRLAIASLPYQFQLLSFSGGDPADALAHEIMEHMEAIIEDFTDQFRHRLVSLCESRHLSSEPAISLLDQGKTTTHRERTNLA